MPASIPVITDDVGGEPWEEGAKGRQKRDAVEQCDGRSQGPLASFASRGHRGTVGDRECGSRALRCAFARKARVNRPGAATDEPGEALVAVTCGRKQDALGTAASGVSLATGETRSLAHRNQGGDLMGPAAWLPDGSGLVVAQLDNLGKGASGSAIQNLNLVLGVPQETGLV